MSGARGGTGGTSPPTLPCLADPRPCPGSFWAPRQPDNTDHGKWGRENCAQIHAVGRGLWNDHNCNFTFHWICKRPLSPP